MICVSVSNIPLGKPYDKDWQFARRLGVSEHVIGERCVSSCGEGCLLAQGIY